MADVVNTILKVKRGDTKTWTLYFYDENGGYVDITGYTIFFTAKTNPSDVDASAIISKTITSHSNPTSGETTISLTTTDTANVASLVFDIQVKTATGDIYTILEGTLNISKDVTLRTA